MKVSSHNIIWTAGDDLHRGKHSLKVSGGQICLISSVLYNCSSVGIEVSYWWLIRLALLIDSDCLQMWLLGQNNTPFGLLRHFRHLVQASYDQDSWPHLQLLARVLLCFCFPCMQRPFISISMSPLLCLLLYVTVFGKTRHMGSTHIWRNARF